MEHLDFLDAHFDSMDLFTPFEQKYLKSSFKGLLEIPKLPELKDVDFAYNDQVSQQCSDL